MGFLFGVVTFSGKMVLVMFEERFCLIEWEVLNLWKKFFFVFCGVFRMDFFEELELGSLGEKICRVCGGS